MNESLHINTNYSITTVHNYRLAQALQYTDPTIATFQGSQISNFNIKSVGEAPKIISQPNQHSFIILNIEDNLTLQTHDRDRDYLSD
ncbi:MAG: hypothetical protein KKC68_04210 [Candidatus Thermoplasmatota archaeon]|nr:hypothetical protein [Candidatus Thermoplasmatota archaeon]MBU1940955.1 hypothetical protein [Candidatus Thermoplasmatota archaeon]